MPSTEAQRQRSAYKKPRSGQTELIKPESENFPFEDASVYSPQDAQSLPSRRYTLSLSPQLIYCRSNLLPTLISSKVYRQLEFQAVGSWWIHRSQADSSGDANLYRVPGSREDVFADDKITVKSKRTLMRFLRHIGKTQHDTEPPQGAEEDESMASPFSTYLESKFQVPAELLDPLLSLSLSQASPQKTSAAYAVPRIQRHLASIGVFGPGFGSLLAKWGGGSEICQVGCRALAVGGGIYVLNSGIESIRQPVQGEHDARLKVQLSNGETISTKHVFGSHWDLPTDNHPKCDRVARSISIVSSPLEGLFPVAAEGAPTPAGAVVVFPGTSLGQADDAPPVYVLVHSSETGECPPGQCVLYSSISIAGEAGQSLIEKAVNKLLESAADPNAQVSWSLRYTQLGRSDYDFPGPLAMTLNHVSDNVVCFPPPSLDLSFDDTVIGTVKDAWRLAMGDEVVDDEFMKFEDREGAYDEE
ncbi:GDP dissociation inhibitor-domain-containing protein [Aspergillus taichungensis]|uniref:Rab proteins geranylgeranyltransferase n=1 Tax=Aspergillus taichungensis TaxID=482145 RepID=A0A2J5HW95_9EURO|nr:GDP dissociation inhibitor-domain-containing protein [Aspergillus taichungensis]